MGATTATLVGEGADCRFLGGNAGGGLQDTTGIDASITIPAKRLSEASRACSSRKSLTCKAQSSQVLVQSWPGAIQQTASTNKYQFKNALTGRVLCSDLFLRLE